MKPWPAVLLMVLLALGPVAAAAQIDSSSAAQVLLQPGAFDADSAAPARYLRDRQIDTAAAPETTMIEVGQAADRLTLFALEGDQRRQLGTFAPNGATPILLFFLEETVRAVAEATGGSPFYIRNRMREALVRAEAARGEGPFSVRIAPFESDTNRARLGAFADLRIEITAEPGHPAHVLALSADTIEAGGGYHDRLTLIEETR
ncbi:hypothetical protein ACFQXB_08035 [Plastorhodobacter daqingensis]|uniref:Uncharacterized protein n=1 Tax=Plastorhodobacter daqingensis TaxID=1387281 RepID=A0ABW2UHI2_9RHOB